MVSQNYGSTIHRNALYVFAGLLAIVAFHARDLYRFFVTTGAQFELFRRGPVWVVALQLLVVAGMPYAARQGYWLANVNNRRPTALDGAWRVTSAKPSTADGTLPDWIYFEYNRAFMVVFHLPDGKYETHDFRVDESLKSLAIWRHWLTPGHEILNGKWTRSDNRVRIEGVSRMSHLSQWNWFASPCR